MEFEQCTIFNTNYDFICTRNDGCKVLNGPKFPSMDMSAINNTGYTYSLNNSDMYLIFDDSYLLYDKFGIDDDTQSTLFSGNSYNIVSQNREHFVLYEDIIREHRLNTCGKPLPENLKYLDRSFSEEEDLEFMDYNDIRDYVELDNAFMWIVDFEVPSDLECDTRMSCNVIGVTPEHINEYICEIGFQYSEKPCHLAEQRRAIGLRCIQPEGCTCGNAHCPEHALCKDGLCTYDIYYENHVCPNKSWDDTKSDIEKLYENC